MTSNPFFSSNEEIIVDPSQIAERQEKITQMCIDQMLTIYDRTIAFTKNLDSAKGLAIFGPPGVGKTVQVEQALNDSKAGWEPMKGATLSAIGFYYTLFYNRSPHRIICLDDFDLINHPQATHIMAMLKVATENSYKPRLIKWTKQPTPYMKEHNIPNQFEFFGNIIWITNESPQSVIEKKRLRTHVLPLVGPGGRFSPIVLNWNKEQKYCWTKYLIEKKGALGENCEKKRGGYSQEVQDMTLDFLKKNLNKLIDVTPRFACNIADDIVNFPDSWETKAFQVNSFGWDE